MMDAIIPWSETMDWAKPNDQETIFLLVRHGQTFGNDTSDETTYAMTGSQTDYPLNEKGRKQASEIADTLGSLQQKGALKVSAIFSSYLKRAQETAGYFSESLGLDVEKREALREINWGDADGKLVKFKTEQWGEIEKKIAQDYPDRKERWNHLPAIPNAEKFNDVLKRVQPELERIGEAHQGKIVIIVTHGRIIKSLASECMDKEDTEVPPLQNCCVGVFRFTTGKPLEFVEVRANR